MHAEASSEKKWAWAGIWMAGLLVFMVHTHIFPPAMKLFSPKVQHTRQTFGMTGSYQSIIGMKVEGALNRMTFIACLKRFEAVERGASVFLPLWSALIRIRAKAVLSSVFIYRQHSLRNIKEAPDQLRAPLFCP